MVRLIDERYSQEPQIFPDYETMVSELLLLCAVNKWEFDESDLQYEEIEEN